METTIATAETWTLLVTDEGSLVAVEQTDCGEHYHTTESVRTSETKTTADLSANEVIRRFHANAGPELSKQDLYRAALDAMNSRKD